MSLVYFSSDTTLNISYIFVSLNNDFYIILGKTLISRGIQMEVCDKFIIHLTKVLIGVLEMHPFCYVELIPTSLEFSVFYCFTEAGQALAFERFVIQCLNLMKGILLSTYYKPAKVLKGIYDG